jgi:hypothetical protein
MCKLLNKYTKVMPLDETIKYSKGLKDFKRIETVNNSSNVLMYFLKRFQEF